MGTKGVHDGHRERMRERVLKCGISSLQQHEVLEFLLFPHIPRRDTNEIAHALISEFGSLIGVMNASAERLADVKGMTKNAAIYLTCLPDVFRMYLDLSVKPVEGDGGIGNVRTLLGNKLLGYMDEAVCVAAVDVNGKVTSCDILSKGKVDAVEFRVRQVVDYAINHHAKGIAIAHNHPGGALAPSGADIELTYNIFSTLEEIGVDFIDHFIFNGQRYYSFSESGKLENMILHRNSLKQGLDFYEDYDNYYD